ncbi:hypothetical protein RchiOBHm_Chr1g0364301 [Rosa chinensis]|uniref:Uncharacterized protein n=1 Tax=Rosa chinensis TaxID=74649 RepID=A0A2P6SJQ0_ROSCH|nr:hypothetical protein RchiOBHm_Chr1g0364301 [Rosa chinensis]
MCHPGSLSRLPCYRLQVPFFVGVKISGTVMIFSKHEVKMFRIGQTRQLLYRRFFLCFLY